MPPDDTQPSTDDLLEPSLTEADDAHGFDRPWDPRTLTFLTFFIGLPGGGALLALNARRLGLRTGGWTAACVVVVSLLVLGVTAWLYASGRVDEAQKRTVRLVGQGVYVVTALLIARTQTRRFRLFEGADGEKGPLLGPGIIAALASWLLSVVVVAALVVLFGGRPL